MIILFTSLGLCLVSERCPGREREGGHTYYLREDARDGEEMDVSDVSLARALWEDESRQSPFRVDIPT